MAQKRAKIAEKPVRNTVRSRRFVYFDAREAVVDFRRVDDKVVGIVRTKLRNYIRTVDCYSIVDWKYVQLRNHERWLKSQHNIRLCVVCSNVPCK